MSLPTTLKTTTPAEHLGRARIRLTGAAVSLDHVLTATTSESLNVRVEQQAPWIVEELTASLDLMQRAVTATQAQHTIARCEAAEMAEGRAA